MLGIPKYVGISALAAVGVVYHAFSTREQYDFQCLLLHIATGCLMCHRR